MPSKASRRASTEGTRQIKNVILQLLYEKLHHIHLHQRSRASILRQMLISTVKATPLNERGQDGAVMKRNLLHDVGWLLAKIRLSATIKKLDQMWKRVTRYYNKVWPDDNFHLFVIYIYIRIIFENSYVPFISTMRICYYIPYEMVHRNITWDI